MFYLQFLYVNYFTEYYARIFSNVAFIKNVFFLLFELHNYNLQLHNFHQNLHVYVNVIITQNLLSRSNHKDMAILTKGEGTWKNRKW